MSKVRAFLDRLTNVMSGMGTTADRRTYAGYNFLAQTPQQVEAAYRTSWLMRKIVDVPAIDMTRTWRSWQTDRDIIEQLEAEEKRLQLKAKIKRALVLARLFGGGGLVLGVKGQGDDPMRPLDPSRVAKGGLPWIKVYSRHQLTTGNEIENPDDEWTGHPEHYLLNLRSGGQLKLHPSRVVAFVGQPAPEGSTLQVDWFWGDPLYQSIETALKNADLAQDGFASLIDEAKIDIVKMPELMEKYSTDEYESRLLARLQAASMGKSAWRTLLLDGEEEWQQRQIAWQGMPEMITSYLQIISGAADIPITRLLGTSPKGLQSTGDGERADYHDMIEARQDEMLCPALDRIDQFLIPSALGSTPDDIWYRFNPLSRLAPKDAMQVEKDRAATIKVYSDTGLLPSDALAEIAKNAITESGQWPGSEIAFEEAEAMDGTEGAEPGEGNPEDDPDAMREVMTPEEIDAMDRKAPRRIMRDAQLTDARPRSLYVSRKVVNAAEIIAWAKAQGFETTQPASELHVTVAFSRKQVDWMAVGDDWSSDPDGLLRIKPGGPRLVEALGDGNAIALLFRNDSLEYRHQRIHSESVGAEWKWPEYQPHITITWQPGDLDLAKVEPYTGPIVLGPEIFAEVVEDWEKTIVEDSRKGPLTR